MEQLSTERFSPPKPTLPLDVLVAIADIERQVKQLLEDCHSLPYPFLSESDVVKATDFMRGGASRAFKTRMQYYVTQAGFCRPWLDEAADETVAAMLQLASLRLITSSRFPESVHLIKRTLREGLQAHIEEGMSCIKDRERQRSEIQLDEPEAQIKTPGLDERPEEALSDALLSLGSSASARASFGHSVGRGARNMKPDPEMNTSLRELWELGLTTEIHPATADKIMASMQIIHGRLLKGSYRKSIEGTTFEPYHDLYDAIAGSIVCGDTADEILKSVIPTVVHAYARQGNWYLSADVDTLRRLLAGSIVEWSGKRLAMKKASPPKTTPPLHSGPDGNELEQFLPTSISPPPGGHARGEPRARRRRHRDSALEQLRQQVRNLRKDGLSHREICDRLADRPRPPRAIWRDLKWPIAYKAYTGAVTKWLSDACQ